MPATVKQTTNHNTGLRSCLNENNDNANPSPDLTSMAQLVFRLLLFVGFGASSDEDIKRGLSGWYE